MIKLFFFSWYKLSYFVTAPFIDLYAMKESNHKEKSIKTLIFDQYIFYIFVSFR